MSRVTESAMPEQPSPTRSIEHFCEGETCFRTDPTNFRSTRHLTKDRTFLQKAGTFEFRTIAIEETIREPVNTFREFSQFIQRMPSHKAQGFSAVQAENQLVGIETFFQKNAYHPYATCGFSE